MTDTNRSDKIRAAHDRLEAEVSSLVTSEDWQEALRISAKFHRYSFNNQLLIAAQAHERGFEPSRIAGYRKWQELERQVRKGEKGLAILAPSRRKFENDDGEEEYRLTGFRVISVFDISQTDGEPVPSTSDYAVAVDGGAPADFTPILDLLRSEGFTPTFTDDVEGGANGITSWIDRTVRVRSTMPQAQQFKTLVHEAAHVLLHDRTSGDRPDCRGTLEVEAESVAFVVSEAMGLDTGSYSFGYVAGWAGNAGKDAAASVRETGERVVRAARSVLGAFEGEEV